MIEKILDIQPSISLLTFYGINEQNLNTIRSFSSKVKIIARSDKLKIIGPESETEIVEKNIQLILEYIHKNNTISDTMIKSICNSNYNKENLPIEIPIVHTHNGKQIKAITPGQQKMVTSITQNDLIFAVGEAGTGKTFTAVALAVKALKDKLIKKIVITRPAVESGENLGFLPGDLKDKLDPYLQPLYDALKEIIPKEKLKDLLEEETIQIVPLAFMRGRTLKKSFVILDEAQNATKEQLKMFLTRMGKNTKFIITGDLSQIDLPKQKISGLKSAIEKLSGLKKISCIYFKEVDNMRHPLVSEIIKLYK